MFFGGGGVTGGAVVGASDDLGGEPIENSKRPQDMAATIYEALGLPRQAIWQDSEQRPMPIYHGDPIGGLTA